jgi:hypothetical protein
MKSLPKPNAKKKEPTELDLVSRAYGRLKRKKIPVGREVPALGRYIDLAYFEDNKVYAFEFKLKNWIRALKQSRDHLLGADYAYICMPERKISENMTKEIEKAGVGLAFFESKGDWPFRIVIEARKSAEIWAACRRDVKNFIEVQTRG